MIDDLAPRDAALLEAAAARIFPTTSTPGAARAAGLAGRAWGTTRARQS